MRVKKRVIFLLIIFTFGLLNGCGKSTKKVNEELTNKINAYVDTLSKDKNFSGAVLVAKKGTILTNKAIGNANYELTVSTNLDTKFRIGNITNSFTAAAILQMEQKGVLSVEDTVVKYIPSYPKGDKITISQLLNHTSGIPNYTTLDEFNSVARLNYPLQKVIDSFKSKPLEFVPGSKNKYSDSNYILLGFIIEKISGKKYFDYINEYLLKPLKMNNTGLIENEVIIKNKANGYNVNEEGKLENVIYQDPSRWFSSSGMYSTIGDLYLWDRALYGEKIIDKKQINKFFNAEEGKDYVNGWSLDSYAGHKVIFQTNNVSGFSGSISRFIKDDSTIIVLSNITMSKDEMDKIVSNISVYLFQ
ncbi:MAG: beta-lactamase family protein [Clostridiaceae bacterium]|nr:beta-lactamase family protein [Clostridiaceae bacterium]